MRKYILKRILAMIPVVLGVTILIFTLLYFAKGNPAQMILGSDATAEEIALENEKLGLDEPYLPRLGKYLKNVFFHFDLGKSYFTESSVTDDVLQRFPITLKLALLSVSLAVLIGVPLGVIAAVKQHSWLDNTSMFAAIIGMSMPNFWLGILLSLLFALKLHWLPPGGIGGTEYYILPCVSIALGAACGIARQTRSSMLEVIRQDYIVTARAKGVSESKVIWRHALMNSLIPVITQIGFVFAGQFGGAVVAETIFSIPGLGSYMITAIQKRDYPAVQGSVLVISIVFSLIMLLIDLLYAFIDPRIKAQYKSKNTKRRKEKNQNEVNA